MKWPWTRYLEKRRAQQAADIRQRFQDAAAVIRWNLEHPDRKI